MIIYLMQVKDVAYDYSAEAAFSPIPRIVAASEVKKRDDYLRIAMQ